MFERCFESFLCTGHKSERNKFEKKKKRKCAIFCVPGENRSEEKFKRTNHILNMSNCIYHMATVMMGKISDSPKQRTAVLLVFVPGYSW